MNDYERITRTRQAVQLAYADVRELTGLVDDLVQCGDGMTAAHWRRAFDRSTKLGRGCCVLSGRLTEVVADLGPEDDPA